MNKLIDVVATFIANFFERADRGVQRVFTVPWIIISGCLAGLIMLVGVLILMPLMLPFWLFGGKGKIK